MKNTTIPFGLFDEAPSKKRSVDLLKLITKDIINILAKEESDTEEISNFIDDELPPGETTTELEDVVSDPKSNETMLV